MRNAESKTIDLRAQLSKALQAGWFTQALDLYELIEKRKPDEPRWAHRKGDLLRRMGRQPDAVIAYERAVHLYSAKGFGRSRHRYGQAGIGTRPKQRRECSNGRIPRPHADSSNRAGTRSS